MTPAGIDYESILQALYEAILAPGDVAVDVGAHKGRHTFPMARRVGPGGKVHAFEPLPACQEAFARRLAGDLRALAPRIVLRPFALGDRSGESEFVVARDALGYSGLKERVYDVPTALERIKVQVRTLDSLLLDLPALRYIKVDAEGGEYHVLRGAEQILRKHRPVVTTEFGANSIGQYGITPGDLADLFARLDYRVFDIRGREVSDRDAFVRSATVQEVWDYLSIPRETDLFERRIAPVLEAQYAPRPPEEGEPYRSEWTTPDLSAPRSYPAGELPRLPALVKNASQVTWWPPREGWAPINVGILWFRRGQWDRRLGEHRSEIFLPLRPGESVEVDIGLPVSSSDGQPLPPGSYDVHVGLVQEGVTWFMDRGDPGLHLSAEILPDRTVRLRRGA
jgi:FkbM family methyltransferase